MNRFSAREFALLCVPVIFIAGAGLCVPTRPAPEPLHLKFRVEKPTTLEAFKGADTVLLAQIQGDNAENVEMDISKTESFLDLQTDGSTDRSSSRSQLSSSAWSKVWMGQIYRGNVLRLPVNAMSIPAGKLDFGMKTQHVLTNPKSGAPATTPMPPLQGKWPVDRAQFAPFDFKAMSRLPLVRVRSAKVISTTASYLEGETTFDLLGEVMNAQTPVDFDLSGTVKFKDTTYGASYGSEATVDPKNPMRRTVRWSLSGPMPMPPQLVGDLSGRISANERWPLAFQFEPIDLVKAKAGQSLKFTQWPAPIPKL